ncbi:hypothetical protein QAD02_016800 [Eretmocerus hayati]|uniref:Uncharacterized protein n=1 Tax=Eretmocerus hayati TaxID=131215 RepID=A0ACC2PD57_9HYME|nr:hypothetical protein QAD02_016800 [Eretmocerus hayati]
MASKGSVNVRNLYRSCEGLSSVTASLVDFPEDVRHTEQRIGAIRRLETASTGASSSPESQYQPRRLDGATPTCWCGSPGTAATSRRSDNGQTSPSQESRLTQPDPLAAGPSSSKSGSLSDGIEPETANADDEGDDDEDDDGAGAAGPSSTTGATTTVDDDDDDETDADSDGPCSGCGRRRPLEISYTIEDLDLLDHQQQAQQQYQRSQRTEVRKYRSFLSPDDALRDLRKHAAQGAEIRWELHTSRTDVDLAARGRCGCHPQSLTPQQQQRGDLRKHHSAETDKWSLRPEMLGELRRPLSHDSRVDRDCAPGWSLRVPELHANPKQRCTCPKPVRALSVSPQPSSDEGSSRRPSPWLSPSSAYHQPAIRSRSLTPEGVPAGCLRSASADSLSRPVHDHEQSAYPQPLALSSPKTLEGASSRQDSRKQPKQKALRSRWAMRPHLSLPAERKDSKKPKAYDDLISTKSKSLKERHKYSVRRSLSPEPDQLLRADSRVVRRLVSPGVQLQTNQRWAPYEGYSPLPNVGVRKREPKKLSDIRWQPCLDESPLRPSPPPPALTPELDDTADEINEPQRDWSPFHNVTPTHLPPPLPLADGGAEIGDAEDALRWRLLNQVSSFPIYQGAWREETPPPSPKPATPVWSPQRQQQQLKQPSPPSPVAPPPERKRSTLRLRSRKSSKLTEQQQLEHQQFQQQQRKPRPKLVRSKALQLLDAPAPHHYVDPSKRSLSEEVRRYSRSESTKRALVSRAKSEDATRFDPQELREYVTTV